jgi:DNA modification methylase
MNNEQCYHGGHFRLLTGDAKSRMKDIEDSSVQSVITSPPYWGLREYGDEKNTEIGIEPIIDDYIANMVELFHEVKDKLTDDGTLWLNIGDTYTSGNRKTRVPDSAASPGSARGKVIHRPRTPKGLKPKDLIGLPWLVAHALQADGWYVRSDIIWMKPNQFPDGNVKDRPFNNFEHVFLMSKSLHYYYDYQHDMEPNSNNDGMRRVRTVWSIPTSRGVNGHPAVMPYDLAEHCVLIGSREGDTVMDPFSGSGTTGVAALRNGREYVGCELNDDYARSSAQRLEETSSSSAS